MWGASIALGYQQFGTRLFKRLKQTHFAGEVVERKKNFVCGSSSWRAVPRSTAWRRSHFVRLCFHITRIRPEQKINSSQTQKSFHCVYASLTLSLAEDAAEEVHLAAACHPVVSDDIAPDKKSPSSFTFGSGVFPKPVYRESEPKAQKQ